jgi:hypothetical protein
VSDQVSWPSAIVALALLLVVGAIAVVSIIHYDKIDDALKIWAALTSVVGVITGAFVSYFFTRGTVNQARDVAETAKTAMGVAHERANRAEARASIDDAALRVMALQTSPDDMKELLKHPAISRAFSGDPP